MKAFFTRYSHWIALSIIGFNFIDMAIYFQDTDYMAMALGAAALLSVCYLAIVTEKHKRNHQSEK
jgi:hypothetical protein